MYVPADVDGDHPDQRILEAATTLPEYGGVTGWASLHWAGARWFSGTTPTGRLRPVDLAIGMASIRSQSGTLVSTERLNPADLSTLDGIGITSHVRSVCFEMRYAKTLADAVVVLDMAAYSDLVSIDELAEYARAHPGWTGIPRCRAAMILAEENSWSPPETRLRLIWRMAEELPSPVCNVPIFTSSGQLLGTPDLFEPYSGLAVEYDGHLHLEGARRAKDLDREALFRAHGIETLTFVSRHLTDERVVLSRLRRAYHQARSRPRSSRRWTLDQPEWWRPTETVEQRRALTTEQRTRLLAHRRQIS